LQDHLFPYTNSRLYSFRARWVPFHFQHNGVSLTSLDHIKGSMGISGMYGTVWEHLGSAQTEGVTQLIYTPLIFMAVVTGIYYPYKFCS
jgi:hypothetical protein